MTGFSSDKVNTGIPFVPDQSHIASFVFSHKDSSTYCRSGCPLSQITTPPPPDVSIFPSSEAAKAAGFVPCSVCSIDSALPLDGPHASTFPLEMDLTQQLSRQLPQQLPPHHIPSQQLPQHMGQPAAIQGYMPSSLDQQHPHRQPQSQQHIPVHIPQPTSQTPSSTQHPQPQQVQYFSHHNSPFMPSPQSPSIYGHQLAMRHNRSSSLATSPELTDPEAPGFRPRRASIANGHIAVVAAAVEEITKSNAYPAPTPPRREERHRGEGDHARLVNEACMHIAAAAAAAAAQAVNSGEEEPKKGGRYSGSSRNSSVDRTKQMFKNQRKKRRGGILGFKELAAKAGLSPWHFHRVFRSVTGLTPKAYGDACWNTVTSSIPPSTLLASQNTNEPYQLPSRSMSSSAVKENYHHAPLNSGLANPPTNNMPSMYHPVTSTSNPNMMTSSPMAFPPNYAPASTPTPLDINGVPLPKHAPHQQQPTQQHQQQHQQQFSMPFSTPFPSHPASSDAPIGFSVAPNSSTQAPLQSHTPVNPTMYSANSLDNVATASSSTVDPNDPLTGSTLSSNPSDVFSNLQMPLSDNYNSLGLGYDFKPGPFVDDPTKPYLMPSVGVLMTDGIEIEPSLSMMHLDNNGNSSLPHVTAATTNESILAQSMMDMMAGTDFPQDADLSAAMARIKSPLGSVIKTEFHDPFGRSSNHLLHHNSNSVQDVSPEARASVSSSSEDEKGKEPNEPWMASGQPLLDGSDTVPPLNS